MPYAIFCNGEQISKAFTTAADVWTHARENGLVVEVHEATNGKTSEFLDNEYEVLPCEKNEEDSELNEKEAEAAASAAPYLKIPAQT